MCYFMAEFFFFSQNDFSLHFFSVSLPIKRKNIFKRNIITNRNMFIFLSFSQGVSTHKMLALLVCLE